MREVLNATLVGTLLLQCAAMAWAAVPAAAPPASSSPTLQGMTQHPGAMPVPPRNRPKPVEHVVDINSASRKELMTLPGIGPAEADKIIKNRPYRTKAELVHKGVLQIGPFLSIRHQVAAIQPGVKVQATKTQNNNRVGKPSSRAKAVKAPSSAAAAASANSPKATP